MVALVLVLVLVLLSAAMLLLMFDLCHHHHHHPLSNGFDIRPCVVRHSGWYSACWCPTQDAKEKKIIGNKMLAGKAGGAARGLPQTAAAMK